MAAALIVRQVGKALIVLLALLLTACGTAATPTATPPPTPTAAPTTIPTPTQLATTTGAIQSTGPLSGTIRMEGGGAVVSSDQPLPDVSLLNFEATVRLVNPYAASGSDSWRYGLVGRLDLTKLQFQAVALHSDGRWAHTLVTGGEEIRLAEGPCAWAALGAGQSNELRWIVLGNQGQLWINGQFVTALDMSGLAQPGNVLPNGFVSLADQVIRFADLTIGSLDR